MSEHAQEPWKTRASAAGSGFIHICNDVNDFSIACGESEADMRRVVACVNACAGIDTRQLETYHANGEILRDIDERVKAEQQRDELLSVLKKARPFVNAWPQCRGSRVPYVNGAGLLEEVDAAIAKVEAA